MTPLQKLASECLDYLDTKTRSNGETYIFIKDGSPEWFISLCHQAHDYMPPDDWKYHFIYSSIQLLAENEDHESIDIESDIFVKDLLAWLSSSLWRLSYCDDACDEYGIEAEADTLRRISLGQYHEKWEVFNFVRDCLLDRLESEAA